MVQNAAFSKVPGAQQLRLLPEWSRAGFEARGETTEGDLGDLEAENLDSLEDNSLVAQSHFLNSLVAPQGGRRI